MYEAMGFIGCHSGGICGKQRALLDVIVVGYVGGYGLYWMS